MKIYRKRIRSLCRMFTLISVLLYGCSQNSASNTKEPDLSSYLAAVEEEPDTVDFQCTSIHYTVAQNVFNRLVEMENNTHGSAVVPLSNGMRLYVTVPVAEPNKDWQNLIRSILIASVILLVIGSVLTMRFANQITEPLLELTEAAKQVDAGNYDVKLDYKEDDEVGILTRTFSQLIGHLKSYIGDLNNLAYADALTSVRNKGAFDLFTKNLQERLDRSDHPLEFAVGYFDCDDLKAINDHYGHEKGDLYLKAVSHLICSIFKHSPVFRVGGDEFAVILEAEDYANREELIQLYDEQCEKTMQEASNPWDRVSAAKGIAVYAPAEDKSVVDVVRRADRMMYEEKRRRKQQRTSK